MKTKKIKRKREFSKIISMIALLMWLVVNFFGMTMMVVTLDLTPMMYVIGSVDAVVAIVLPCYFNKAKMENQIKLQRPNVSKEYIENQLQNAEWE